jgi:2-keto-3-deoxy-L-rhamnonate aldolase RhmA
MLTRVVDCGASTLVVPHVDSLAEARFVADKVRFPPRGRRSIPSPTAAAGFRPIPVADLVALGEDALEVLLMIESREGLADAGAIAALDGIDGLLVGANDLAQSLGHAGDVAHQSVLDAFLEIAVAAGKAGKVFGVMGVPLGLMNSHALDPGASYVVATNDINLLFDAGVACVAQMRALSGDRADTKKRT